MEEVIQEVIICLDAGWEGTGEGMRPEGVVEAMRSRAQV